MDGVQTCPGHEVRRYHSPPSRWSSVKQAAVARVGPVTAAAGVEQRPLFKNEVEKADPIDEQ